MSAKALDSTPEELAESPALPELQPLFPDTILWRERSMALPKSSHFLISSEKPTSKRSR